MALSIVLTGSIDQLGSYILESLLRRADIQRIWCLNALEDARTVQEQRSIAFGLDQALPLPWFVEFVEVDFSIPGLNIAPETRNAITNTATHILHCDWPVNRGQGFDAFEPAVRGVTELIDLTTSCKKSPVLMFMSSVQAVGNWAAIPGARESVPEEEVEDWKVARGGFGQSKLVAERLLADASRERNIKTAVCRIGQVSGPVDHGVKGAWPKQDWIPSLIASSTYLCMLPRTLGPAENVQWIPVDRLGSVVVDLIDAAHKKATTQYYHIRNPNTVEWHNLMPAMVNVLTAAEAKPPTVVDFEDWVNVLEMSSTEADLVKNPAARLLPFFRDLRDKSIRSPRARAAVLEMKNALRESATLQALEEVDEASVSLWSQQWKFAETTTKS